MPFRRPATDQTPGIAPCAGEATVESSVSTVTDAQGRQLRFFYANHLLQRIVLPDGTERMGSPNPGYWGRVSVLVEIGRACEAVPVVGAEFTVGRERGDLTFPTDGYVSSSHCRVVGDDSGVYLEDRGSSNGTYLRVRSGTVVPFGSLVLIGQQLFHVRTS